MKKVIVFDLDDTLFCWRDYVFSGFEVIGNLVQEKWNKSNFADVAKAFFTEGKRNKIFNITLDKLGIEYDETIIKDLLTSYRSHIPSIKLHSDAISIIPKLKEKFNLALITDGSALTQRNKVQALKLNNWIDPIIYTDELGPDASKPNTIAFEKVMDHFKGTPESYMYVGDNPLKDFIPAKALGWKTLRIIRPNSEYEKMRVLDPRFDADESATSLDCLLKS